MDKIIEQFKNIFAHMPHASASRANMGPQPRRDWLVLLIVFFIALCISACVAWYTGSEASNAHTSDVVVASTVPSLDSQSFEKIQNYFQTKAYVLQSMQNGTGTPSDPSQ